MPSNNQRAAPAASAIVNGYLYYAEHLVTPSGEPTTAVRGTIRRTNGYTDDAVARISVNPWNTDATQVNRAVSMLAANGGIYIGVCDKGQTPTSESETTNPDWGRVLFLNTETNQLTEVNAYAASSPVGYARTPCALAHYADRLFVGTTVSDGTSNTAVVHQLITDAAPRADLTLATGANFRFACMAVFQGQLYAGLQMRATGVSTPIAFATVRTRVAAASTAGNSPWSTSLTATGGTAQANNTFVSMVVFTGTNAAASLYVSYFNNTQTAKIYKYDGTSWTTEYTASTAGTRAQLYLFVDKNSAGTETLYAFGLSESTTMTWLFSTDGSAWTDRTTTVEAANPHAANFGTSLALPVFFGFDQL